MVAFLDNGNSVIEKHQRPGLPNMVATERTLER